MPRPKKKRKPKSMRGKKKPDASSALAEALDIFGFSTGGESESEDSDGGKDD